MATPAKGRRERVEGVECIPLSASFLGGGLQRAKTNTFHRKAPQHPTSALPGPDSMLTAAPFRVKNRLLCS